MKRVVVYCRVSTDHEDQKNSLENQRLYFEEYVKQHKDWKLVEIYADEGISGTSLKKRADFNRMYRDRLKNKYDIVLTKEVCRFARNTVDTLEKTRELKKLGIEVRFIIDNISTFDTDGELRLTIMAGLAQDESRRISERVQFGVIQSMKKGVAFGNIVYGYDFVRDPITGKKTKLVINEKEAKIIKEIFNMYLYEGKGAYTIAKELKERGIEIKRTRSGKKSTDWREGTILDILQNVKYIGDLKQRKTYTVDNNNNITINFYYRKKSNITINYMDKYTNNKIDGISSDVINNHYGDSYNTEESRTEKEKNTIFNDYDYTNEYAITPENTSLNGTINTDNIIVNYYYKKKATITVNYYKEGTTEKLADSDTLIKYYDDTYDVSTNEYKNKSTIPSKYEYSSVNPSNEVKGTVNQDTVTINYYYKLKKSKIIINYYKEGTTEKLADTTTLNQTYDDKYDVTSYKDNKSISMDYRYVSYTSTPENALSGIVSQDTITVNYYYALKEATINIKYLDELTRQSISNEENINTKYGVLYNTLNLDSYKKEIPGYDYSKTETTPISK